ncbi:MAG: riboflavin synthase [Brachybacterium sp.]|uniref:riboflavin synthase n=1 Tax=Brachybacterium sp. TaxID=1891286 RepID=UPI00264857A1|nr:riboflavin synthase [Brachybacterium sp.]MDN5686559.1 riboflavin synthase [Brachybacterium sp.]
MFTGIIEELGTVETLEHRGDSARLTLRSPQVLEGISLGDSIAVSGCCLTVAAQDGRAWSADVITTTLEATSLGSLSAGDRVNLERCVRADGRLDGHIVQGHVDAVAEIVGRAEGEGTTLLHLSLPDGLERYVVDKGSIAVDGISLTVAGIEAEVVTIGLIPETLERTTLGTTQVGDVVNLEVDVLAKYVEKLSASLLPGAGARR